MYTKGFLCVTCHFKYFTCINFLNVRPGLILILNMKKLKVRKNKYHSKMAQLI